MEKRIFYAIVLASIVVMASVSSAAALTVSVAASDSSSTSKTAANYLCSGANDQTQISNALNAVSASGSGTVYLSEGTFKVQFLRIPANVVLQGKGPATTRIVYTTRGNMHLPASDSKLIGVEITGPAVVWVTAGHVMVQDVILHDTGPAWAAFSVENHSTTASVGDIEFRNCQAIDCNTNGFCVGGADISHVITNLRFINCRAVNCGKASPRFNSWVVGFDLAETVSVDGLLVDGCYASGSYESGFHFEGKPVVKNAVLRNCVSENNGLSPTAKWGAGYVVGEGTVLENCRSNNNQYGFYIHETGLQVSQCIDTGSDISFFFGRYLKGAHLTNVGSKNAKESALTAFDQSNLMVTNMVVENCLGSTPVFTPRPVNSVIDWHHGSVSSIGVGTSPTTPTPTTTASETTAANWSPRDLDLDDKYEDVNGNGRRDFADIVLYFNQMTWIAANQPVSAFDYNGNERIDFADVVQLFNAL